MRGRVGSEATGKRWIQGILEERGGFGEKSAGEMSRKDRWNFGDFEGIRVLIGVFCNHSIC